MSKQFGGDIVIRPVFESEEVRHIKDEIMMATSRLDDVETTLGHMPTLEQMKSSEYGIIQSLKEAREYIENALDYLDEGWRDDD